MSEKNYFSNIIKLIIFGFGGLLGALINWTLTYSLTEYVHIYYVASSLMGNSVNSIFNFLYHRSITFKVGNNSKERFVRFIVVNLTIIALNVSTMFVLTEVFRIWYLLSSFLATCTIMIVNFILNQSFVFFEMGKIDYRSIEGQFYDRQQKSLNPLRAWLGRKNSDTLRVLVNRYYKEGGVVVDFGYGNCSSIWNTGHAPVVGADINKEMLACAKAKGRLRDCLISDLGLTGIRDNSVDLAIVSDVLQHLKYPGKALEEINRVLKPGGILIVSVPYDKGLSLWKPLFTIQCILQGYLFGNEYYRNRCGHVNGYSPDMIRSVVSAKRFNIVQSFDTMRLTIFMAAVKEEAKGGYEDTTIIVPTLNERENIAKLLDVLESTYPGSSVIVADDGSSDGTRDIVRNRHALNSRITLLDRSDMEHGLTASVVDAIKATRTKYMVVIDADFQHPPEAIKDIIALLKENELVVGTRVKVENWGLSRRFMSLIAMWLGKATLFARRSASCKDILSGFFGARTDFVQKYVAERPSSFSMGGYKILFDLLKLMPPSTKIGEVLYTFMDRSEGHSKINRKHIIIYFNSLFK